MLDLYYWTTPNGHKITMFLEETGLPYRLKPVNISRGEQFDPDYMKLNPKAVVPTLIHHGYAVVESTVICEYLDEVFPDPPLKPDDPRARAEMRLWTKAVDEVLHPMCGEITFACSHRYTIARLQPEELAQFLASHATDIAAWQQRPLMPTSPPHQAMP